MSHDTAAVSADVGVGRVVTYRRAFRRRTAVVVGVIPDGYSVLESSGGPVRGRTKFSNTHDTLWVSDIESPLFRLETLAHRDEWGEVLRPWIEENREGLLATIGDRRKFCLSAISHGDIALARMAGLSATEMRWLEMHAYRHAGETGRAFSSALALAPDAYPDHILVLIEAATAKPELLDNLELQQHARGIPATTRGRLTLEAALGVLPQHDLQAAASEIDLLLGTDTETSVKIIQGGSEQVDSNLWSRAATGTVATASDLETLFDAFPSIADDLIDANKADTVSASELQSTYLRARVAMGDLETDDLRSLEATDELARRAYTSGNLDALNGLPAGSPAVLHFSALDTLRRGDVPGHIPEHDVLKAVAASLRSGIAHPNALADESVWRVLGHLVSADDADSFPENGAAWHLEQSLETVASWDFESAITDARLALRSSHDEAIRDEALNIIGFVLFDQGRGGEAITALEKALEGAYSANLQANIGIVAQDLQPEIAAEHLGRLADEAPTLELKLAAARHAFSIWTSTSEVWDDDDVSMPTILLSTFRELVIQDIPYEDYVHLVQRLSLADSSWVAVAANTLKGPHSSSAARQVYVGRASDDPGDYVDALADVSRTGNTDDWFVAEKDGFVQSLRSLIFSEEGSIGPASYAFGAIEAGLELDDFDYVTLACGSALSILPEIAKDDGLPSDKVIDMIEQATKRAKSIDPEQRELVDPLVAMTGNQYASVVADFHAAIHDQIMEAMRSITAQMHGVPRRRINWSVVEEAVGPMRTQARKSAGEVKKVKPFASDSDLKNFLDELDAALTTLASRLSNTRRLF